MHKINLKLNLLLVVFISIFVATSCSKDDDNTSTPGLTLSNIDYADKNNWIAFVSDPSKDVDIFVIYPTMAGVPVDDGLPYVNLNSTTMRDRAS